MSQNTNVNRKNVLYSAIVTENQKSETDKVPKLGQRHVQVLIYFLFLTVALAIKSCMSTGIVVMMDPKHNSNPDIPTYPHWTNKNIIISSFFWAYAFLQPFSGIVVHRYGAKWFLVGGLGICSVLHIFIPQIAAWFGSTGLIIVRVVQGISQSAFYPSTHTLLSQWVPSTERSRLGAFTYTGITLGFVISSWLTGPLAATPYGWPMMFYLFGFLGLLLTAITAFLGYNRPADHPYISYIEKFYIESDLGHLDEKPHTKTPWRAILTSKPFWALACVQVGDLFGFWGLMTQIPSYMNYIMNFDMKTNSFMLALPYIVTMFSCPLCGILCDYIVLKKWVSIGAARKIANSIALLSPAICLIYLGFVRVNDPNLVMILLTIAVTINGATTCGWVVNHMDLSPNYSGTIMGLTSGMANTTGFLAPLVVDFLVKDEKDIDQWNQVFFLSASVYIVAVVIYDIFGSGKRQPWNEEQVDK